jgi:Tol biopolymer transport system component
MDEDGSNMVKLTDETEKLNSPAWSPDGTKIVFGGPVNKRDIWVMNADGSNKINLTDKYAGGFPAWSPDSSKITFSSTNKWGNSEIWVMNADGSNQINLTGIE